MPYLATWLVYLCSGDHVQVRLVQQCVSEFHAQVILTLAPSNERTASTGPYLATYNVRVGLICDSSWCSSLLFTLLVFPRSSWSNQFLPCWHLPTNGNSKSWQLKPAQRSPPVLWNTARGLFVLRLEMHPVSEWWGFSAILSHTFQSNIPDEARDIIGDKSPK
jgi:hypothetical protein